VQRALPAKVAKIVLGAPGAIITGDAEPARRETGCTQKSERPYQFLVYLEPNQSLFCDPARTGDLRGSRRPP
jgi:hypothetical protein